MIDKLISSLHPLERKVLPLLDKNALFQDIVKASRLQDVEVMRALQWLQNKGIVKVTDELKEVVSLDKNGEEYLKEGLPEIRFLKALGKEKSIAQVVEKAKLKKDEVSICLGVLRGKAAINIRKDKDLIVSITEQGRRLLEKDTLEEKFLKLKFPLDIKNLNEEERFALENLKKRKDIIKVELKKIKKAELTDLGKKIIKEKIDDSVVDRLTPDMLKTSSWKNKKLRHYDIKINVPLISGGKKQQYRRFLDYVRKRFLALGFTEMFGPIVETNFWDMDALFMPQFHSARDIHSAYFVKEPKYSKLDERLVEKVRQAHENGYGTGSKGWQYRFDVNLTKWNILRTQGTALSARILSSKELKIPGKYFAIARCFRPDVIDATHNVDFYQVEGIVVEEGIDFRHLKALLRMFAEEFAETDQIKIKPAYFPFTEPSAELFAKHPELGWIELGGSGIFRSELVNPLVGKEIPVLAWGIGIDRIAMFKLGIKDIRQLFSHDLDFLRNVKIA